MKESFLFIKNILKIFRNNLIYLISASNQKIIPNNYKRNIVVFLGADYGNLGDVAITESQILFLKEHFPDSNIVEIPISKTFYMFKSVKKNLKKGDIITLIGGGHISDLYEGIEQQRRFIIKKMKDYIIISFPQTIYFTDTRQGEKSKRKTINIYKKHPRLYLCAREKKSYQFLKDNFNESKIFLVPDIVLSKTIPISEQRGKREGIILCIRRDKESALSNSNIKEIIKSIGEENFTFTDTQINKNKMSLDLRRKELRKIIDLFLKSQLIITDRLHGMILSAITNTPCLAIDNKNGKVSGVYNLWLKKVDFIELVRPSDITINKINQLCHKKCKYSLSKKMFQPIIDVLKKENV